MQELSEVHSSLFLHAMAIGGIIGDGFGLGGVATSCLIVVDPIGFGLVLVPVPGPHF